MQVAEVASDLDVLEDTAIRWIRKNTKRFLWRQADGHGGVNLTDVVGRNFNLKEEYKNGP